MKKFIKQNRHRLQQELKIEQRRFFSPAVYGLDRRVVSALKRYVRGRLLDIGCGDMPYREMLGHLVQEYRSLDIEARADGVSHIGSVEDMSMIADRSFDTVLCLEVLEHVADPFRAIKEVGRVLRPGGVLILSVPHLSRLHEQPRDYYRYTQYGIEHMLREGGFEPREIEPTGALLSFLGHQFSTFIVCAFWRVPGLRWVVFYLNKWFGVLPCYALDRLIARSSLLPLGHVCVAQKT